MRDILRRWQSLVCSAVEESISGSLNMEVNAAMDWSILPRLEKRFRFCSMMTASGESSQALILLQIHTGDEVKIFPGTEDWLIYDTLGELCNITIGKISSEPAIMHVFGELFPSPPVAITGRALFPKIWGIEGKVKVAEADFLCGFAICG